MGAVGWECYKPRSLDQRPNDKIQEMDEQVKALVKSKTDKLREEMANVTKELNDRTKELTQMKELAKAQTDTLQSEPVNDGKFALQEEEIRKLREENTNLKSNTRKFIPKHFRGQSGHLSPNEKNHTDFITIIMI